MAEEYLAAIHEQVIEPLEATAELFEGAPYITRLYTTMSADEMTVDPVFGFNGDLGDVSNVHNADRVIECSSSVSQGEAPWRIQLPDGRLVVRGRGTAWPFGTASGDMPANARVLRVGESGTGVVVADNTDAIAIALADHNRTFMPQVAGGGCNVSPSERGGWIGFALGLGALGFAASRRRRTR